jgi:hypothetical protein
MKYNHAADKPVARVVFLTAGKISRLIALALLSLHTAGLAQETTERALDDIIVTAIRIQTTARDASRSLSVVIYQGRHFIIYNVINCRPIQGYTTSFCN